MSDVVLCHLHKAKGIPIDYGGALGGGYESCSYTIIDVDVYKASLQNLGRINTMFCHDRAYEYQCVSTVLCLNLHDDIRYDLYGVMDKEISLVTNDSIKFAIQRKLNNLQLNYRIL